MDIWCVPKRWESISWMEWFWWIQPVKVFNVTSMSSVSFCLFLIVYNLFISKKYSRDHQQPAIRGIYSRFVYFLSTNRLKKIEHQSFCNWNRRLWPSYRMGKDIKYLLLQIENSSAECVSYKAGVMYKVMDSWPSLFC